MDYLIVVILSFLIIGAVVIILSRVRTPRYRLARENVITLLKMVLDGTATENDWNVFVGIPIRYNPELENIRRRCMAIEKQEFLGGSRTAGRRHLFTQKGLEQLQAILAELEAKPH